MSIWIFCVQFRTLIYFLSCSQGRILTCMNTLNFTYALWGSVLHHSHCLFKVHLFKVAVRVTMCLTFHHLTISFGWMVGYDPTTFGSTNRHSSDWDTNTIYLWYIVDTHSRFTILCQQVNVLYEFPVSYSHLSSTNICNHFWFTKQFVKYFLLFYFKCMK